jgi:hypothetical protein
MESHRVPSCDLDLQRNELTIVQRSTFNVQLTKYIRASRRISSPIAFGTSDPTKANYPDPRPFAVYIILSLLALDPRESSGAFALLYGPGHQAYPLTCTVQPHLNFDP